MIMNGLSHCSNNMTFDSHVGGFNITEHYIGSPSALLRWVGADVRDSLRIEGTLHVKSLSKFP